MRDTQASAHLPRGRRLQRVEQIGRTHGEAGEPFALALIELVFRHGRHEAIACEAKLHFRDEVHLVAEACKLGLRCLIVVASQQAIEEPYFSRVSRIVKSNKGTGRAFSGRFPRGRWHAYENVLRQAQRFLLHVSQPPETLSSSSSLRS